ncbi:MAG: CHASE3 domain-containing protein, partial [Phenylobacterium sp.]
MPQARRRPARRIRNASEAWTVIGLSAVFLFFLVSGGIAYRNVETLRENSRQVFHTHTVIVALGELLSTVQDAETGQRGYILTGDDRYLEPYETAVASVWPRTAMVAELTRD